MKPQSENSKASSQRKPGISKNTPKFEKDTMTKSKSSETSLKMKGEKAWSTKEKFGNCRPFSIKESKMPMSRTGKCKSTTKKVTKMTNKLSSSETKLTRKEEKARLTNRRSKSSNTYWPKNFESSLKTIKETLLFKAKLFNWQMKFKENERKVWLMKRLSENFKESWKKKPGSSMMKEAKWGRKKMIKFGSFKTLLKMKGEKAWWTKKKSENFSPFSSPKSDKPTNSTIV